MKNNLRLYLLFGSLAIPCQTRAQAPPTTDAILLSHHIALTREGLEGDLSNRNPELRGLAAGYLAEHGSVLSIPAITLAMKSETVSSVKINFASTLSRLEAHVGDSTLQEMCANTKLAIAERLSAALKLVGLGNNHCDAYVVDMLCDSRRDLRVIP